MAVHEQFGATLWCQPMSVGVRSTTTGIPIVLREPEAGEANSMVDNNDALLQAEMVQHEAMKAFLPTMNVTKPFIALC